MRDKNVYFGRTACRFWSPIFGLIEAKMWLCHLINWCSLGSSYILFVPFVCAWLVTRGSTSNLTIMFRGIDLKILITKWIHFKYVLRFAWPPPSFRIHPTCKTSAKDDKNASNQFHFVNEWMNRKQLYAINKIRNSLCHVKFWFYHLPYIGPYLLPSLSKSCHGYSIFPRQTIHVHVFADFFCFGLSFYIFRKLFQWFEAIWLWLKTKKVWFLFHWLAWVQRAIAKFKRNVFLFLFVAEFSDAM